MTSLAFVDLIVDQGQVLLWLKQWDSSVFGSEIRSTSDEVLSALKRHSTIAQHHKPLASNFQRMNRGPKWANSRYGHSRSTDESGDSKGIQDISDKKAKHTGQPEQKVITAYHLFQ